jgi:erythromycin esterase-like protein
MAMATASDHALAASVREGALPLTGAPHDYDALLDLAADAHFVLLGEASHGSHEFYRERALITQRLIAERGFTAVAAEADWPDAWRVNRYVDGRSDDAFATEALDGFRRFPTWMWRNTDVVDFVDWLRDWNDAQPRDAVKAGFYGLDLYSLHSSMQAVLQYLDTADPVAAARARERYACFDHYGAESQTYGMVAGPEGNCEAEVVAQLLELQQRRIAAVACGNDSEAAFVAEQNARLVKNAERYYRSLYLGGVSSWNLRDEHMMESLEALVAQLEAQQGQRPRVVIWAHNSHLGDARATEMGQRRHELNLGQLVRQRHGRDALLVGFTTHSGAVTAASAWEAPAERKRVRPARPDSYEGLFHATGLPRFLLALTDERDDHTAALRQPRLERAIGVIYRPETERQSHYFAAHLSAQFDVVLHFDSTRAVEPLERTVEWHAGEAPETYPSGM